MQDQKLMNYFNFDESDLEANRNGQLTDKQRKRLGKKASSHNTWLLVIEFIIAIGFIGGGVVAIAGGGITSIVIGIVCFALALLFVWWGITSLRATLQVRAGHLKSVTVKKAEGPVNIVSREVSAEDQTTVYELHIGKKGFDVADDLPKIMMQGDVYSIYYHIWDKTDENYLTTSNILSVELISKAK